MNTNLITLINSILYGLPRLTPTQKLFASNTLRILSDPIKDGEFQWFESSGSARPLHSPKIQKELSALSTEDTCDVFAFLSLFLQHVKEKQDENVAEVEKEIQTIIAYAEVDALLLSNRVQQYNEQVRQFHQRPVIEVPIRIWPLVLDFVLRLVTLFVFDKTEQVVLIFLINIYVIPLLILVIISWVGKRNRHYNDQILGQHPEIQFKIHGQLKKFQYTLLAFMALGGAYIGYVLAGVYALIALAALPLYYFILLRFFNVGRIRRASFKSQLEAIQSDRIEWDADRNDEEIVKLETQLTSITSRLEAYVLESALFGALSFSGFLQIMSADHVSFNVLEQFAQVVFLTSKSLILGAGPQFIEALSQLNTKENLFCLLSLESLVCSILFLGVIASRLRFSNVADRVLYALNLAKAFNQKEELALESGRSDQRLKEVNIRVNTHLQQGWLIMHEVQPIMELMQYLRNGGLLIFLLILISSGFFISSVVAMLFIGFSLLAWLYFNRQSLRQTMQYLNLQLRTALVRYSVWILCASVALIFFGFLLRIQWHVNAAITDKFVLYATTAFAVYIFTWLVFYPHADIQFGAIEKSVNQWQGRRWLLIKIPFAIFSMLTILGLFTKLMHVPGADEMVMIGFSALSLLSFFLGFYLSRPRWLSILPAYALSTSLIGSLFKTLHLAGADEMIRMGVIAIGIVVPVMILLRKRFHRLFLIIFFVTISMVPLMLTGVLDNIGIAYIHKTWSIKPLRALVAQQPVAYMEQDHPEQLWVAYRRDQENCDWYLKQYGTENGLTFIYRLYLANFELVATVALEESKAGHTTAIPYGLQALEGMHKILKLFGYTLDDPRYQKNIESWLRLSAELNHASGQPEETLKILDEILASCPSPSQCELARKLKSEL